VPRRLALAAFAAALAIGGVLLGVACGYEGAVTASPETVEGTLSTPTETGPQLPTFPKGTPAAGKAVFASAGCGSCHTLKDAGSTGTVGPNLDEAQPDLTLIHTRVYFGQGGMPSFKGQLTLKQMADVAAYVYSATHGGAPPPAQTQTTPTETTPTETTPTETTPTETTPTETTPTETTGGGNAAAGKEIFASAGCASCHTLEAAGSSGTVGPNLDQAQPDLALIVDRVTNGRGAMPPFKDTLSAEQIQDVAAFVFESTHGG
jgi:mono/diheme cytochrome c family protein